MTYEEAKIIKADLEAKVSVASAALGAVRERFQIPNGVMGLTPDKVKFSPEYKTAKQEVDSCWARLQNFNKMFCKVFEREYAEERAAKRNGAVPVVVSE